MDPMLENSNSIQFSFYVPMYGSGAFIIDDLPESEQSQVLFFGIPEGTGEIIKESTEITRENFRNILTYIINELKEEIEPETNFGCSISFHNNDTEIASYGEGVINYDKFTEIQYSVINNYAEDLSCYLW